MRRSRPQMPGLAGGQIGGIEDENLAHHVRVLLVAAHEADHPAAGCIFDDLLEALAHQLSGTAGAVRSRLPTPAGEQGLLYAGEAAAQDADHQIVLEIGLGAVGPRP